MTVGGKVGKALLVVAIVGVMAAGCDPTGPVTKRYVHYYTDSNGKGQSEYRLQVDDQQAGPQDFEVTKDVWDKCPVHKFYPDCGK